MSYDTGQNEDQNIYFSGNADDIMAQRYEVPSGSRLASVSVAPVYDNQFQTVTFLTMLPAISRSGYGMWTGTACQVTSSTVWMWRR